MNMAYSYSPSTDELLGATDIKGRGISSNEIDRENVEINKLVAAARDGNWLEVWKILGEPDNPVKGYLINVIPESRRWGILHQAIYWQSPDIVKKVLSYNTCDCEIPTKPYTFDNKERGVKNPKEIAHMYSHEEITRILYTCRNSLKGQILDTYQLKVSIGDPKGFPLLRITLAAYKRAFNPKPIDPNASLLIILKNIFEDVDTSDERWKAVQDKVCEAVEGICKNTHEYIEKSSTREAFYAAIIGCYTEEKKTKLYDYLNTATRRQNKRNYRPESRDLALGPFILMYEALLLFWNGLKKEYGKTYRRMLMSEDDKRKYSVGTKFMWTAFVSSSTVFENAVAFPTCEATGNNVIIFTIDNSTSSIWQPRNIEPFSRYIENERTYPIGAYFEVKRRNQAYDGLYVDLELLKE